MPLDEKPVSSAFTSAPRMASYFRGRVEQQRQSQPPQQQLNPESQQILDRPYQPPVEPQPMQFAPQQQPQAQQVPQYQQSVQAPVQQPVQPAPQYDPALTERLLLEREEMAKKIQEQQTVLQQLAAERQAAQQEAETKDLADSLADSPEIQNLETVDPEDAKRLVSLTAQALSKPIAQMKSELAQQRTAQVQAYQQLQEEKRAAEVFKVHPDIVNLYRSDPNFIAYMKGREGYSSRTREELAFDEYMRGNTAYVNDVVSRYKQGAPNAQRMATVPPVQVAGSQMSAAGQDAEGDPGYNMKDLLNMAQMHRISQDEFRYLKDRLLKRQRPQ